jgi:hypothetical protein
VVKNTNLRNNDEENKKGENQGRRISRGAQG